MTSEKKKKKSHCGLCVFFIQQKGCSWRPAGCVSVSGGWRGEISRGREKEEGKLSKAGAQ